MVWKYGGINHGMKKVGKVIHIFIYMDHPHYVSLKVESKTI